MAVRDHTGRSRPSIPLDGTLTSFSYGPRPAGKAHHGSRRRHRPMIAISYLSIPLVSPGYVKTGLK